MLVDVRFGWFCVPMGPQQPHITQSLLLIIQQECRSVDVVGTFAEASVKLKGPGLHLDRLGMFQTGTMTRLSILKIFFAILLFV